MFQKVLLKQGTDGVYNSLINSNIPCILSSVHLFHNEKGALPLEKKLVNDLEFGNSDIPKGKKQQKQRNHVTEAQKQISSQETVGVPPQDWTSQ